jgi:hypothetical protein
MSFIRGFEKTGVSKAVYDRAVAAAVKSKGKKEVVSRLNNRHGHLWQERVMTGKRGQTGYKEKPYETSSQREKHYRHGIEWRLAAITRNLK